MQMCCFCIILWIINNYYTHTVDKQKQLPLLNIDLILYRLYIKNTYC